GPSERRVEAVSLGARHDVGADGATDRFTVCERGMWRLSAGAGGGLGGDQILERLSLAREQVRQNYRRRTGDRAPIELELVSAIAAVRAFRLLHGQVLRDAKEGQGSTLGKRRKASLYNTGGGRRLPHRARET